MYISKNGLELIKRFEGLRLKAYRCPAGKWTIGFGHTKDVYPGMTITEELADKFLVDDIWNFEQDVKYLVRVPLSQGQFDALVCFAFNVGSDIDDDNVAEGLGDSTLLRLLNSGDSRAAANEFPKWNTAYDPRVGKSVPVPGLTKRRSAEQALFIGGSL